MIDWTFYCFKCDGMASAHLPARQGRPGAAVRHGAAQDAFRRQQGTRHFGRDEVLALLGEYYKGLTEKVEINCTGRHWRFEEVIKKGLRCAKALFLSCWVIKIKLGGTLRCP